MIIDRPLGPDGRIALAGISTSPCLAGSRPFILAAAILSSAMGFIDGSVVTIALPSIERELSAPFETVQWVVNGYALTLGSVILIGGAAGDRYGRKLLFLTGVLSFTGASVMCALAPSILTLVGARLLQGIGAALMIPQSLAILTASFPKAVRGRAIGIWAGASAITTALGPPLGGRLIDQLSWRAAFWINLPIACTAIWLTLTHVPESRDEAAAGGLDWPGGFLAVMALGALTEGFSLASASRLLSLPVISSIGLAALGLVLFLMREMRAPQPLLPPQLFRNREFAGANLLTLFLYGAFSAVLFLLPFDLIARRGYSVSEAGLVFLPIGLVVGLASRSAGRWAAHRWTAPAAGSRIGDRRSCGGLIGTDPLKYMAGPGWARGLDGGRPGDRRGAAYDSRHERGAGNRFRDCLGGEQRGEPPSGIDLGRDRWISRRSGISRARAIPCARGNAGLRFGVLPDPSSPARATFEAAFVDGYRTGMLIAVGLAGLAAVTGAVFVKARDKPA